MSFQGSFRSGGNTNNPFGSLWSLLIFVGVLVLLFFALTGFVKLLYFVAPVLLIATLFINYRVVMDYVTDVLTTFQTDILWGVVKVLFAVVAYPLVIGWLFTKALMYRKVAQIQKDMKAQMGQMNQNFNQTKQETEFADYEELSSDLDLNQKPESPTLIELPKSKDKSSENKIW
jgi:predicted membrane protein